MDYSQSKCVSNTWSNDAFPILSPDDLVSGDEAFQDLWSIDDFCQIPSLPRAITPEAPVTGFSSGSCSPLSDISTCLNPNSPPGSHLTSTIGNTGLGANPQKAESTRRSIRCRKQARSQSRDVIANAKLAHSTVERRYRDNLNVMLNQLRQTLSATETLGQQDPDAMPATAYWDCKSRKRKSDVLMDAIEYIHHAEVEMRHLSAEIKALSDGLLLNRCLTCDSHIINVPQNSPCTSPQGITAS